MTLDIRTWDSRTELRESSRLELDRRWAAVVVMDIWYRRLDGKACKSGAGTYGSRAGLGRLWREGERVRFTQSKVGRNVYAFCLEWPGSELALDTVRARPGSEIRLLGTTGPLAIGIPAALQEEAHRPSTPPSCFRIAAVKG